MRVSIYVQVILFLWQTLFPLAIDILENWRDNPRLASRRIELFQRVDTSTAVLLLTNGALLIASFIKVAKHSMSPYHALIVLNLSWIVNVVAFGNVFYFMLFFGNDGRSDLPRRDAASSSKPQDGLAGGLHTLYLIATGALGLILFGNVDGFAHGTQCPHDTILWTFGSDAHIDAPLGVTSYWYPIYAVAAAPLLNAVGLALAMYVPSFFVLGLPAWGASCLISRNRVTRKRLRTALICIFPVLALVVLLILCTKMTIAHNPVAPGELDMGFGQILALLLLAPVLRETRKSTRAILRLRREYKRSSVLDVESDAAGIQDSTKKDVAVQAVEDRCETKDASAQVAEPERQLQEASVQVKDSEKERAMVEAAVQAVETGGVRSDGQESVKDLKRNDVRSVAGPQ